MCGIFGYIGKKEAYSFDKLTILGVFNDSRGGDSAGFYADGKWDYIAVKNKLYGTMVCNNELLKTFRDNPANVFLGHCRKASVGGIGLDQAQPVVLTDQDGNVLFTMIHNGTLVNYKELANKYEVKYELGETDSQIFAKVIYKAGYKVLGEYIGAGAFVFHDMRDNKVYMFKGKSKSTKHTVYAIEERPLFVVLVGNNNEENKWDGLYFSSMERPLAIICCGDRPVYEIKENTLFVVDDNNKLSTVAKYDRTEMHQTDIMYEGGLLTQTTNSNSDKYKQTGIWRSGTHYNNSQSSNANSVYEGIKNTKYQCTSFNDPICYSGRLHFIFGRYKAGTEYAHGTYKVNSIGNIKDNFVHAKEFIFWNGVMLKEKFFFTALEILKKSIGDHEAAKNAINDLLPCMSYGPYYDIESKKVLFLDKTNQVIKYTGDLCCFFSDTNKRYNIENGEIKTYQVSHMLPDPWQTYNLTKEYDAFITGSEEDVMRLLETIFESVEDLSQN